MSLVLKTDLEFTDLTVAFALRGDGFPVVEKIVPAEDGKVSFIWHLPRGTFLPEGPLHPIAALAFAMAGFVLEDNQGFRSDEEPLYPSGWYWVHPTDGLSTNPKVAPEYARIVGHRNPEVL